ncbi:hypothetical protein GOP47_0007923 [Adiantum capillus-veneris]|uniref:Pantoate--beta-alanine ligase n=1 Tax=Adiantum capillus-veneris TaxID=13818 RepID=A0A9D4ZJS1_ADICA|nr:hypothetical protein GOP47_0007361 [Adiantum capillus-veneris]KAI5078099.1 hypothetical protein GOP47_0007923 [Adiantum capillus-veneris]
MDLLREKNEMREWSRAMKRAGKRVALVPTMGSLHAGHLSLVQRAKQLADVVVVSIYVNPSQFSPTEDFGQYPRDVQGDLNKLQPFCVDAVFNPHDLYVRDANQSGTGLLESTTKSSQQAPNETIDDKRELNLKRQEGGHGHETWVRVEKLELPLCGRSRPGFFRGVATVVTKLFNIIEPDVALFGKKDYQQWRVICRMVRDLDFAIEIIGCDLQREEDGLAMSSRNVYLSSAERLQALSISRSLMQVKEAVLNGIVDVSSLVSLVKQEITSAFGRVDYIEISEQESLRPLQFVDCPAVLCVAAWFGRVRLIDNIELEPSQPQ